MSKLNITDHVEVCRTGKLQQFYTLYVYRTIVNGGFCLESRQYVQNVAMSDDKADANGYAFYEKRKEVMEGAWGVDSYNCFYDFLESPKREYCDLTAFGYSWKKTPKGFCTNPDKNFWEIWKQHKTALKEAGFAVFKDTYGDFILFFRNCPEEEMLAAFELLEEKQNSLVVVGDHIGDIKERIRDIQVVVTKVYGCDGPWGYSQKCTFEDCNGNIIRTSYSGSKKIEVGSVISLTATVKKHDVFDGKKVTFVNRINF